MRSPLVSMVSPVLLCLLAASGCAYTLRYSVRASYDGEESPGVRSKGSQPVEAPNINNSSSVEQPRTFTAEHTIRKGRTGYSTEKKLLGILFQSLENLGWYPVSGEGGAESPAYTFTVGYERPKPAVNPQFGFSASTGGGSGFFFGTIFDTSGSGSLRILRVTASPPNALGEHTWTAEIRTESSAANLIDLARHALPIALERFPEPGYWEFNERVVKRREASSRVKSPGETSPSPR